MKSTMRCCGAARPGPCAGCRCRENRGARGVRPAARRPGVEARIPEAEAARLLAQAQLDEARINPTAAEKPPVSGCWSRTARAAARAGACDLRVKAVYPDAAAFNPAPALRVGFAIPASFLLSCLLQMAMDIIMSNIVMIGLILAVGMLEDGAIGMIAYADKRISPVSGPIHPYVETVQPRAAHQGQDLAPRPAALLDARGASGGGLAGHVPGVCRQGRGDAGRGAHRTPAQAHPKRISAHPLSPAVRAGDKQPDHAPEPPGR
ncbi:acriflavin resistance protein [Citreicella sp. 357]|nr:acriflavin resistance protein [Citreicella sp. 357]